MRGPALQPVHVRRQLLAPHEADAGSSLGRQEAAHIHLMLEAAGALAAAVLQVEA